ncbi:MAG: response regulator [Candidatus Melainabacteria bacterium]|nr:response regulator [Candidatus Melainabacteria bacterium]
MRFLLAEDDDYLARALAQGLGSRGYAVDAARSGKEAIQALSDSEYDLLILDLGLPEVDGSQILRLLRERGSTLPVIIITARDAVQDRIAGLDLGANDYLTKPFDFGELEARIRAILRKNVWGNRMEIHCGLLRFVLNTKEVFVGGEVCEFTPRESAVLEMLLSRAGRLVPKKALVEHLASWEEAPSDNAMEIVIHRLRRKLCTAGVEISTVRGFGYLLRESQ